MICGHRNLLAILTMSIALSANAAVDADDAVMELVAQTLREQRPAEVVEPWTEFAVQGAIPFRGSQSVYFVVSEAPADGKIHFPRLNNQVRTAFVMDANQASSIELQVLPEFYRRSQVAALTQTPTDWTLALPDNATFPLVIALDLVEEPLFTTEPFCATAGEDGVIVLQAHHAEVQGEKLQYEPLPHKNTVGYWVNPEDWAEWSFEADAAAYDLLVLQGCGEGQGGSFVDVAIDDLKFNFQVEETGHFQNFRWRTLGEVSFDTAGRHQLTLRPEMLAHNAVMDVRQIRLVPTEATQTADRDVSTVVPDLVIPPLFDGPPTTGRRVVHRIPDEASEQVYHTVYLPTDWREDRRYPVIVDLAGNGPYQNALGDTCSGRVEDSQLGFGLTGGDGWIVVSLPYLNEAGDQTVTQWWGDAPNYEVEATLEYWKRALDDVCDNHGGDRDCIVLAGFSRGAIACNYLGLNDDSIAPLWSGFVCFSHYDGVLENWPYPERDRDEAIARLRPTEWPATVYPCGNFVGGRGRFGSRPELLTGLGSRGELDIRDDELS